MPKSKFTYVRDLTKEEETNALAISQSMKKIFAKVEADV